MQRLARKRGGERRKGRRRRRKGRGGGASSKKFLGGTLVNLVRAVKQTYTSAEEEGEKGGVAFRETNTIVVAWSYVKKEASVRPRVHHPLVICIAR